jgi:hypothetical protein
LTELFMDEPLASRQTTKRYLSWRESFDVNTHRTR